MPDFPTLIDLRLRIQFECNLPPLCSFDSCFRPLCVCFRKLPFMIFMQSLLWFLSFSLFINYILTFISLSIYGLVLLPMHFSK
jgi:hypothetical protein